MSPNVMSSGRLKIVIRVLMAVAFFCLASLWRFNANRGAFKFRFMTSEALSKPALGGSLGDSQDSVVSICIFNLRPNSRKPTAPCRLV